MTLVEELFNQYRDKVEYYIGRKVSDKYVAEDLTSIVFLKVCDKLSVYDENKASVATWIYTIANNTVIDYYRTHKTFEEIPDEIANAEEIDENIINEEMLSDLATALKKLPERERDLLIFRYYDNMTLKDIAVKMEMSYANAKIVQAKAINHMREYLAIDDFPI
ncbi:MAG: sigma-70 family RNA polymerase sigma factor [Lachnospiraceae bacterium]|nr:sigma-70 family RNA polymerase sigma factor [Lachnospiraceae bacterium]